MTTPPSTPIRVLVVDDHPTMRYGLKVFLSAQPDMVCVGEAKSGETALQMCRRLHPDVVLIDVVMPGMDGPTAIGLIRSEMPDIHLIALTTFDEVALAQKAIRPAGKLRCELWFQSWAFRIAQTFQQRIDLMLQGHDRLFSWENRISLCWFLFRPAFQDNDN